MDEFNNNVPEEKQEETTGQNVQPEEHTPAQDMNYYYNTNYNTTNYEQKSEPMSVGDYLLTMLALLIPCVGIVLYFVWAFGKDGNINRKNFCRAYLIIFAISIVLGMILLLFSVAIAGVGAVSYYY